MCRFGHYHEPFYFLWNTILRALSSIQPIVGIQINVYRNKIYGIFYYVINNEGRGRSCPQMPLL